MNLVVGATGHLGFEIARLLRAAGKPTSALVRSSSAEDRVKALKSADIELRLGDLKDRASLAEACRGVATLVSTASSTLSRQTGDSIETVDLEGQLQLVREARLAGVRHFIFVSFASVSVDFALQRAKRAVELALAASGMTYTVVQPVDFMEIWLSPVLGFDPKNGAARILGSGEQPVSWVSMFDVARFTAGCVDNAKAKDRVIPLGGPQNLTFLDVVREFESAGGPSVRLERIPEADLEKQLKAAENSLQEAFAALMLGTARGYAADHKEAIQIVPMKMTTVREYADRVLRS